MEIILPIVTFFAGYFLEKILDRVSKKIFIAYWTWIHARHRKRYKEKYDKLHPDVVSTEVACPLILPKNVRVVLNDANSIFLALPEGIEENDLRGLNLEEFCQQDYLVRDLVLPGFSREEVENAIEDARREIAGRFIRREDGLYFNGDKYGVYYLDTRSRTSDAREDPCLHLEVYRTDHFTHRVIGRALEMLSPPAALFGSDNLNGGLNWVRTSFGISVIVITADDKIIMTRRSQRAGFADGRDWIYVSVTEALSQADVDPDEFHPDLTLCVRRGLKEELGIDQKIYADTCIKFYDCFFETHFFQDGIVASVTLPRDAEGTILTFGDIETLPARDRALEIAEMFWIKNSKSEIRKFIEENHEEMRSQTIFALQTYLASLL